MDYAPPAGQDGPAPSIQQAEALLSNWFGCEVILTSSGRAAIRIALADLGMDRYRDRIAVSPITSSCVLEAIVRQGFPIDPVEASNSADATVLIHQYGFTQRWRPAGPVVEDISHAFFAGAETGQRSWVGDRAIFSLPKFFSLAGMAGGVITSSRQVADCLRARLPREGNLERAEDREIFRSGAGICREEMYLRCLLDPRPDPAALSGLPDEAGFKLAGQRRSELIRTLLDCPLSSELPPDWRELLARTPPFAFPVFGEQANLERTRALLTEAGVTAGLYRIDRNRDNRRPHWTIALLIPCHQYLSSHHVDAIACALR